MFQMKKGSKVVKNLEMWMNEWIKCTHRDNNYDNNFIDFNLRHEDFSTKTVNTMTNETK